MKSPLLSISYFWPLLGSSFKANNYMGALNENNSHL